MYRSIQTALVFVGLTLGLCLAASANLVSITGFEEFNAGDQAMFRQPTFSGSTSGNLGATPNTTAVVDSFASTGMKSLNSSWSFLADTGWLRLTTFGAPFLPNPTIDYTLGLQFDIFTDRALYVTLASRETGTSMGVGQNGGTSGGIEWIGGVTDNTTSPPKGHLVAANAWTTLQFYPMSDPIKAFAGATADGILSSATGKGTIEHLAFVPADGAGAYSIYLDNFAQFVIPEPSTIALAFGGLALIGAARLRRRG